MIAWHVFVTTLMTFLTSRVYKADAKVFVSEEYMHRL